MVTRHYLLRRWPGGLPARCRLRRDCAGGEPDPDPCAVPLGGLERGLAAVRLRNGRDNGEPGPRKDYSPTYFAAFLIDPDGNNVEAVCT